jgi:predicted nucleotidyltransferase
MPPREPLCIVTSPPRRSAHRAARRLRWYPLLVRRDDAIALIRSHLPELRQRFGVRERAVFGSVARDEATAASDVDVLVEFDGLTSFDGYFGVKERLEELLGTRVDLATPPMLKPRLKVEVEREGVRVA